jgi:hypothetical protein
MLHVFPLSMMNIKSAHLWATIAVICAVTAQQLEFTNFPLNLTLPIGQSLALTWHGQDNYVNISFAQFYFYGGGSEFRAVVASEFSVSYAVSKREQTWAYTLLSALNTASSITFTPDPSLQQGVYGFFIATPNRNSSESPFFALVSPSTTSASSPANPSSTSASFPATPSGLSDAAKVGIGLGVSLGLIILACIGFIFWRERSRRRIVAEVAAIHSHRGQVSSPAQTFQPVTELEAKNPVHELRGES